MDKINEFYNYLKNERRYSINTINSYKRDLNDFIIFLNKENCTNIDSFIIKSYLANLYTLKLTKKTIARRLSSIKSYYKFMKLKYNFDSSFINEIHTPKQNKSLPDVIYDDELEKILNYKDSSIFTHRNQAIIYLLISSGLRVSELVNVTLDKIDLDNRYIIVLGKGNKERICPFSEKCKTIITNYLNYERGKYSDSSVNYLLVNKYGNKLTTRYIEKLIENISLSLFGNKKLHPHLFRHTYATKLLNNGADIRVVQELLGHESLSATQVYTHVANKELTNIYKSSHHREDLN